MCIFNTNNQISFELAIDTVFNTDIIQLPTVLQFRAVFV